MDWFGFDFDGDGDVGFGEHMLTMDMMGFFDDKKEQTASGSDDYEPLDSSGDFPSYGSFSPAPTADTSEAETQVHQPAKSKAPQKGVKLGLFLLGVLFMWLCKETGVTFFCLLALAAVFLSAWL